ncbi:hypothetical protein S58_16950 [Bradyrhizobium oligotrophicum S58]|uniref:Uncharacterized protein n=1 Tax=Bradyrhizobium oligotrophicum S58 TaxID=1245469 RepID=M4Z311_9BRAD|nr:hypothetical protein [Bradyrhizobium oligotrophicum]BAM87703.1 hypothetical protein S58_16950 [Bradyrhizobium oligotrophicum S58]
MPKKNTVTLRNPKWKRELQLRIKRPPVRVRGKGDGGGGDGGGHGVDQLWRRMNELEQKYTRMTEAFAEVVWKQEIGIDIRSAKMRRTVPVRIYIGDELDQERDERSIKLLKQLVWDLAGEAGYSSLFELPDDYGSFKKFTGFISKWLGTEDDALKKIEQLEAAARTVLLDKPSAEVNVTNSKAVSEVIAQLAEYDEAALQLGNMVIVKRTLSDGRKMLMTGLLSRESLQKLERDYVEQIKPENSQRLLEESSKYTIVEQTEAHARPAIASDDERIKAQKTP